MLEQIFRVPDIRKRYGCAESTARKYMRQMRHTEKPLTVTESAIKEWDDERTVHPVREVKTGRVARKKMARHDGHIVPRIRT